MLSWVTRKNTGEFLQQLFTPPNTHTGRRGKVDEENDFNLEKEWRFSVGYEWERNNSMDKYPKIWRKNSKYLNLGRLNFFQEKNRSLLGRREGNTGYLVWPPIFLPALSLGGWTVWTQSTTLLSPHSDGVSQMTDLGQEMKGWSRLKVVMVPPALPCLVPCVGACTQDHICCQAASPCNDPPSVPGNHSP